MQGDAGRDLLLGGAGNDTISGYYDGTIDGVYEQRDTLDPDALRGEAGADTLIMGSGDRAVGEEGADLFASGVWVDPDNPPIVEDFVTDEDQIAVIVPIAMQDGAVDVLPGLVPGEQIVTFGGMAVAIVKTVSGVGLTSGDVILIGAENFV